MPTNLTHKNTKKYMPLASKSKKVERPPLMVLYLSAGGVGKTTALTTFPDPLILDAEAGTRNYESTFEGAIIRTKQFGEALRIAREFKSKGKVTWKEGSESFEYVPKTIGIDPLTAFWDGIQAATFQERMNAQGIVANTGAEKPRAASDTFQQWGAIKMHWKVLHSELQSCGINFVATCHEKEEMKSEKNEHGKLELVKTGKVVADTEKNYMYVFDLVLRLVMEGDKRYAVVLKSRLKNKDGTDRFRMNERLEKWDYDFLIGGMTKNVVAPKATETEADAVVKDQAVVEKDPTSLKIAHELRSKLLPKYGISNEDLALYACAKVMKNGVDKFATLGADGKLHLSEIPADRLQWLVGVLEGEKSLASLKAKIQELKDGEIPGLEKKTELAEAK